MDSATGTQRGPSKLVLVLGVAICVGAAGSLPHLFFLSDTGGYNLFENAWDESFYSLAIIGKIASWNDYPARVLQKILLHLTGGPSWLSGMLSDILWPMAVALAAGFLALTLVRGYLLIVPAMIGLIFASDIFSFNSSVIFPVTFHNVLGMLPLVVRKLFSDPTAPFLNVYRTPEPQLSLSFFFCYVAIVVWFVRRDFHRLRDWAVLSCAGFICVQCYPFFALASLMIGGMCALSLLSVRQWKAGLGVLAIVCGCALYLAVLTLNSHAGEAAATRFSSSLPMLAPSIAFGLALLWLFGWRFRGRLRRDPEVRFALLCFVVPIVTLNQQVVTGLMVQAVNWERYVNYPCLVVGTAILLRDVTWRELSAGSRWGDRLSRLEQSLAGIQPRNLAIASVGVFAAILSFIQYGNYRRFAADNLLTLAYAKAVDKFYDAAPDSARRVILDNVSFDAQVRASIKTPDVLFYGYTDVVAALKGSGADRPEAEAIAIRRDWGFEHAARLGLTQDQYEAKLLSEIDKKTCWPELMYQFSFLDCAPYVSDFRNYFPEKLKQTLPRIGVDYRQYLAAQAANRGALDVALVLSATPLPSGEVSGLWTQRLVGITRLATGSVAFARNLTVEVYAYQQLPMR